jgi:glycosyltransferase involved in cell wall biosynthesis
MSQDSETLRIGIDGYNLAMPHGTGVATYARTLIAAVTALQWKVDLLYGIPVALDAPADLRETLFYGRLSEERDGGDLLPQTISGKIRRFLLTPERRVMAEVPSTGRVITTGFSDRVPPFSRLFTRGRIFSVSARYFRRYKRFMTLRIPDPPAIMHWTYPLPLRLEGAVNIYTIHDLVPLRLPHTSLEDKRYYHNLIRHCIDTAAHIVTVSEASRRDIIDLFGAHPDRVTNTYQAFDPPTHEAGDNDLPRRLDRLFNLRQDGYFLFFGAIEPKKNLGRLIEAYLRSEIETPLVIVGSGGWKSDQELRLLRGGSGTTLPGASQIRQIDYLPRRMLLDLIQGARAVLFPSLYEGFGLPALEALALGVPLMTSRISSLPEVAGDAAVYVDPYDVAAMVAGLRKLDGDETLRKILRAAGPAQAERFGAEAYCSRLESLYRSVLKSHAR